MLRLVACWWLSFGLNSHISAGAKRQREQENKPNDWEVLRYILLLYLDVRGMCTSSNSLTSYDWNIYRNSEYMYKTSCITVVKKFIHNIWRLKFCKSQRNFEGKWKCDVEISSIILRSRLVVSDHVHQFMWCGKRSWIEVIWISSLVYGGAPRLLNISMKNSD